ncbi:MAG: Spy/CpxP family protein refolding chaperone [Pyrinomonadaceae bacterium]
MKIRAKKLTISIVAAAVLLAAAAVVFSQRPQGPSGPPPGGGFREGPGGPRGGFGPFGPFGRELNLTDEQKAQIKKINDSFRDSDKALFDQLRTLHESEPRPMTGAFDEAAVRAAAEARAKIQIELEVSHAKMMSQIFAVLTAEQRAQMASHHDEMKRMGPPPPLPGEPPF